MICTVCLHVAPSAAIASVREDWKYSRWSLDPPHPKNSSCQHLEGESSQSKTLVIPFVKTQVEVVSFDSLVQVLTALGGAIGASIRSRLKVMILAADLLLVQLTSFPDLFQRHLQAATLEAYLRWSAQQETTPDIIGISVHAFGALLLGILSHPVVPKETFALFVGALRTVSAIVTVDAYNCVASGNQICVNLNKNDAKCEGWVFAVSNNHPDTNGS
eukprot:766348-Hanusia_phi.AAC.2